MLKKVDNWKRPNLSPASALNMITVVEMLSWSSSALRERLWVSSCSERWVGKRAKVLDRQDGKRSGMKMELIHLVNVTASSSTPKAILRVLALKKKGESLPDTSSKHTETQGRENNQGDSSNNARPRLAQKVAFGVGVLNDTGSDDEDPYSMGPQISYNRVIGGDKRPKRKVTAVISSPNPTLKSKPVFLSKKLANLQGALRKCHDGRLPLDGFVLGDDLDAMGSLSPQNDKHGPPDVPQGWKSSLVPEDPKYAPGNSHIAGANRMSSLDAKTRASLLGEAQLPGKSVFDYLSPAARDRLAQASGKGNLPQALGEKPPEGYGRRTNVNLQDFVPKLDQDVALQALNRGQSGWMPYAEDIAKRERYKAYLEIRTGLRPTEEGDELPARADGMKIEDWAVEMQEFARAAQVFKPVTGQMASRFMSSTSSIPNSSEPDSSATTEFLLSRPNSKPEDPTETAAKMGMFGQMTRSFANFYPTRLLCKRFNVPMPEHADLPPRSSVPAFTPETSATLGRSRFESAGFQEDNKASPIARSEAADSVQSKVGSSDISRVQGAQLSAISIDPETNAALEKDKPGQALFKAIFGSDGSDSD